MVLSLVLAGAIATPALGPLDGFGRFGRIHQDGLLTLNVSPSGCKTVGSGENWGLSWQVPEAPPKVLSMDGTHKTLELEPTPTGPSRVEYTLMAPGMSVVAGNVLELQLSEGEFSTQMILGSECQGMLITRKDKPAPPMLVATRWRGEAIVFNWNGKRLRLESEAPIGRVRLITPTGIESVAASDSSLRALVDRPIPRLLRLSRSGESEVYTTTGPIVPLPPIFSHFPEASWAKGLMRGPLTRYGHYLFADGTRASVPLSGMPAGHRAYVRPEALPSERSKLVTELLGDFQNTWAENAVDLGYSRRGPALLAGPVLPATTRLEVIKAMERDLPRALGLAAPTWKQETEPLSGLSYHYTYALPGPGGFRYDIEWGNLLPVYGLEQYALASGDWAMVRKLWPGVRGAMAYVEQSQDWAWMCNVNGDHGFSTGTGDALNAGYVGLVAASRMARELGEKADADRWEWLARRTAIATRARLRLTPFAEQHGLVASNRIVLGFHETEHFTRTPLDGDPWYPVTLLSGNGAFPELLHLYQRDKTGLAETLQRLGRAYPTWMNGQQAYPVKGTYDGNSCYVTMPQLYARLLSANPPTQETAWKWVDQMATNRTHSWVSPNVLAELLADGRGFHLTGWGMAALEDAWWQGNEAHVRLRLPANRATTLSWGGQRAIRAAKTGNERIPITRNALVLPAGPQQTVTVILSAD